MKVFKWLLGVVVVLVLVVLIGGWLISPKFQVSRSVVVDAPADRIYALVVDPKRWKDWSVWNRRDPAMQVAYFGAPEGTGAGWSWTSESQGDGRMTFTAADPGRRVAYDLFFPDFGTTSTGDIRLDPQGAGTRVTWSISGDMGANPVFRWMALFADGMVGGDFEAGLENLKVLAEK